MSLMEQKEANALGLSPASQRCSEKHSLAEKTHVDLPRPERKIWTVGTLTYTAAGLATLCFWLLFGDFAISLRDRSVGPVVQLMLRDFGASNFLMAALLGTIPTLAGMTLGPIVSYKSDRFRSRWGRRIPFLLIPTPIAAAAMIGIAFCPQLATGLQHITGTFFNREAALLTVFAFFWTGFELAAHIAGAVFGGLVNDVVPRPTLGRFMGLWRAVSLMDGMIFNWFILVHAEEHFRLIFIWIAIVFGVGFTLMCLMVREGKYPPPTDYPDDHRAGGFFSAVQVYFRECFSQPYYLMIFITGTLAGLAFSPINSWSLLYAKQLSLGLGNWEVGGIGIGHWRLGYGGILTLTYICSLGLAYPIGSLVDRFHALRVSIAAMLLYGCSSGISFFLISNSERFGWALLVHGVLSGTYFTAAASIGQHLLPRSRFSQFASASGLVSATAGLIVGPFLGAVLDWTGSNYRITFLFSSLFAFAAVTMWSLVYRRFMAMGGPGAYVAPGDGTMRVRTDSL